MNDLFCTPEQGKRLKELLPELKFSLVWGLVNGRTIPMIVNNPPMSGFSFVPPALTLQELRDVAIEHGMDISDLEDHLYSSTAPKLADWVIARLE
jgi:hypothetical protein